MISDKMIDDYQRDGFIVVPDVLGDEELAVIRATIKRLVAGAAEVDEHDHIYDLEPGHTRAAPKVRRIKSPHIVDPIFERIVRLPRVLAILQALR